MSSCPADNAPPLAWALWYAGRGWPVFPCHSVEFDACTCGKNCTSPGKHPRTKQGVNDASTDEATVREFWGKHPNANVAVRTGTISGLAVVDIDPKDEGDSTWSALLKQHSDPDTIESITGSGGRHVFCAYPAAVEGVKTGVGVLGPGIDIRADGGYVVVPPSLHVSGQPYRWELSCHPDENDLKPLPGWIPAEALRLVKDRRGKRAKPDRAAGGVGGTSTTRATYALRMLEDAVEQAATGGRNQAAFWYACQLRDAGLPEEDATKWLRHFTGAVNGKVKKDHPYRWSEAEATLGSVFGREPRESNAPRGKGAPPKDKETRKPTPHFPWRTIAEDVMEQIPLLVDGPGNPWAWRHNYWRMITHNHIEMWAEAHDKTHQGKAANYQEVRRRIFRACQNEEEIPWDASLKPTEIAFRDGILNILTLKQRKHSPSDLLTRILPHDVPPGLDILSRSSDSDMLADQCRTWSDMLGSMFGHRPDGPGLEEMLEEFMGLTLTTWTKHKKILWLFGPTDTGKSIIQQLLVRIHGAQSVCNIPLENIGDPAELSPIVGAAVNLIPEISEGELIHDGGLKAVTGGRDTLTINEKYVKRYTYRPTAKHVMASNSKPRFQDRSDALINRFLVVPCDRQFRVGDAGRIENLDDRLGKEMPGIFMRLMLALRRLHKRGMRFNEPPSSLSFRYQYQLEQDVVLAWIEECCEHEPGSKEASQALYESFREFSGTRMSLKTFGDRLEGLGFRKVDKVAFRGSRVRGRLGLHLTHRPQETEQRNFY